MAVQLNRSMIFVYYNNLQHFTIANRTPLKPRVKPFFSSNHATKSKMQMGRCPHLASAISGLPLASKRERGRKKDKTNKALLPSTKEEQGCFRSKPSLLPRLSKSLKYLKRTCILPKLERLPWYDDSEPQTNADVLSAKKRRLAMLHDIIANASKM